MLRDPARGFEFQPGPIFTDILLADEINRTPPKTQAALLEAMEERQTTIDGERYPLSPIFTVLATENPIEYEGTYPLPEAQLDRFLLHILVNYPDAAGERAILELNRAEQKRSVSDEELFNYPDLLTQKEVLAARLQVLDQHLSEPLNEYIVQIVLATRAPERYGDDLRGVLQYGASPRATIALDRCSRAHAWLAGRDYVTPEDVQGMAHDVLRHRILLGFEAEASGRTPNEIIDTLLARIGVP
jgi:MoxR-like ATPase